MKATLRELYAIGPLPLLAVIALYTIVIGAPADPMQASDLRSAPVIALFVAGLAWAISLIGGSASRAERTSYGIYFLVFLTVGAFEARWSACHVTYCS